jgi:copper homeostasis protein
LEVCVDTAAGVLAAKNGGADRIELCSSLALAGLTPSVGLMDVAKTLDCPTYVMIRPRGGDFVYDAGDLTIMLRDIDAVRDARLDGVVLGASLPDGSLDERTLNLLILHASGLGLTLHRAFDVTPDQEAALETAIGLGFQRILTSGGAASAVEGADRIAALVAQADGRIEIMAGSGVSAQNAANLIRKTGVREIHASCSAPVRPGSGEGGLDGEQLDLILGADGPILRATQIRLVSELAAILGQLL